MAKKIKSDETLPGEPQFTLFQVAEVPNAYRKAVQVVHSKPRAPMTLLQRKLSNAWLKNAIETKTDSEGWWTIEVKAMESLIGYDSKNREYLREAALDLMRIIFEWDVIASEHKKSLLKASVLFPEVEILSHVIRYQISNQLRDKVLNPDIYALIDMNIVRKFRRAPSLALYEHCVRFEKIGRTAAVPWEELRDIVLGESADAVSYSEFKYFRSKVLTPCISEINAESDIQVQLELSKVGKRVTTLQFIVEKKPNTDEIDLTDEEALVLVGEMVNLGIPQSEAKKLTKKQPLDQVRAAISYTKNRLVDKKNTPLENPGAYFRMALAQGWGIVEDVVVKEVRAKPTAPKAASANRIADAFALEQLKQAEAYFKELDAADQSRLLKNYNDQQLTAALRVGKTRSTRASQTAFFRWLAVDTWGKPTTEQLLDFAQTLLSKQAEII